MIFSNFIGGGRALCVEMSDFTMGTILGKGFPQAQVHTVHSTSAMNCMHNCLWKTLSQDCPHGEIRQTQKFGIFMKKGFFGRP